ncbi:hypothetical protein DBR40_07325 [Pedobacter sp. KBW01]|nr:hypothetical protein DBR40_07325 [Pedobacter sp. KBW01]
MALQGISGAEHNRLIVKLRCLVVTKSAVMEAELAREFGVYQELLEGLRVQIERYEEVAAVVRVPAKTR